MSRELFNTKNKNITDKLIRDIQLAIIADKDIPNLNAKKAGDFWEENKKLIINLTVEELKKILRSARNEKSLLKQYECVIATMDWYERIVLLVKAKEELIQANNKKFNTIIFISNLMELSNKILPIILAVL